MSRCLVTGGSGRLGRSVVDALAAAGHDVVSVDIEPVDGLPARQSLLDLRDATATLALFDEAGPDTVVHLAGIAVPFSLPDAEIYATNTAIMRHVLDATERCGATSLLVASSPTVIGYGNPGGWTPSYLPIDERHPLAPWHGYAASKQAMEHLVAAAVRRRGASTRFGIFRPCFVIAPEEWLGAPTQQGHTVRERLDDPSLGAAALFNYVDARDAGAFVTTWLAAGGDVPNGACFFVGAADSLAVEPIAELLPRHLDGVAEQAATLTGRQAVFDCGLARRLLGWTPTRSWTTELADVDTTAQSRP